ncbi:hypothetical protein JCM10207_000273 [Rhodosporidiobolus poonsookiae]
MPLDVTGDGCIQEGVGQEAISVASHLTLDNLILVYNCNKITVDGTINNCFSEDVSLRFKAAGWNVIHAGHPELEEDAEREIGSITEALAQACQHTGAPTLVVARTTIGFGSRKQDTGPAHGQALGDNEVAYVKTKFRLDPNTRFSLPNSVKCARRRTSARSSRRPRRLSYSCGHSGLQADLYEMFGFGEENIAKVVSEYVSRQKGKIPGVGESEELLINHKAH